MLSNFLLPCKCELKRGNTCVSQKIAADGLDKVKFFPRSERYETRADLSRTSQVMLKTTSGKMKASKSNSSSSFLNCLAIDYCLAGRLKVLGSRD